MNLYEQKKVLQSLNRTKFIKLLKINLSILYTNLPPKHNTNDIMLMRL